MRRYAMLVGGVASAIAVAGLAAGCGSSRSVLYSGVSGSGGPKIVITDTAALHDARADRAQWVAEIEHRAKEDPGQRFANLSTHQFRLRLAAAAAEHDFTVKRVQFLHPRQVAPLVIVQTRRYVAFAHAMPAIEQSLDPLIRQSHRRRPAFEGFFLEAQDGRGVPFLGTFSFARGSSPGGGQWARSDQLYPFAHG